MARALMVCFRREPVSRAADKWVTDLNRRLTPDNIEPRAPTIVSGDRVLSALFGGGAASIDRLGIRLGAVTAADGHYLTPGAPVPDGSFALIRVGPETIELVADAAASRTLWYVLNDELFAASTSQRALVSLLGSFDPNREAIAWMLSSGTLGPGHAWDTRLTPVPPAGRVSLDRRQWRLRSYSDPIRFEPEKAPRAKHRRAIEEAVIAAMDKLDLDPAEWVLPLSGGVDSRGLLLAHLRTAAGSAPIHCVTWGRRRALDEPGNDAWVASRLAERLAVPYRYFPVDPSPEPRRVLVERFLVAGEGRVGALSGYLDGFRVWKTLHDEGVPGVIRGDEGFGWESSRTADAVRRSTLLTTLEDYFPPRACAAMGLPAQTLPQSLDRAPGESLATWRDRLYHQFRLPVMLAALTDLKAAYVEVVNPLLCASVLNAVRRLPDGLRTDKRLWRDIVETWCPDVEFARSAAIVRLTRFLRDGGMLELMREELASTHAVDALGPELRAIALAKLEERAAAERGEETGTQGTRAAAARAVARARALAERLKRRPPPLDPLVFAFRAFIVSRMHAFLAADAAAAGKEHGAAIGWI